MERGIENAATSRARCSHAMGKNCGRRLDGSARSCSIGTVRSIGTRIGTQVKGGYAGPGRMGT